MDRFSSLLQCAGAWEGVNRLYLAPEDPVDESATTLRITPLLHDTFVRVDQTWSWQGKPQEGSLLIGCDPETNAATVHWIDTFHMGRQVLALTGTIAEDGSVDVRGTYAAPPGPDWGWRILFRPVPGSRFEIEMFNIEPNGTEQVAVQAPCTPSGG